MGTYATRTAPREAIFAMAELLFENAAAPVRVAVRNVSSGGMMVERDLRVRRGTRVAIDMRAAQSRAGVVVWVRAPLFGIAFDDDGDAAPRP